MLFDAHARGIAALGVARRGTYDNTKIAVENAMVESVANRTRDLDLALQIARRGAIVFAVIPVSRPVRARSLDVALRSGSQRRLAGASWTVSPRGDGGVVYENQAARLVETGLQIAADRGEDVEIDAMLELAREQGWTSVQFCGHADFKKRATTAAVREGFDVPAESNQEREMLTSAPSGHETSLSRQGAAAPGKRD